MFKIYRQCNKNDIEENLKMQHEAAACFSMLQPDMLLTVKSCCSRRCCHLYKHVAVGHVATCLIMLQPDMLPPVQACHVAAGHVAAYSSMLQLDMLPPVQACCSWTCCLLFKHVAAYSSMLQLDMLPRI
jgi:hypothetical protein